MAAVVVFILLASCVCVLLLPTRALPAAALPAAGLGAAAVARGRRPTAGRIAGVDLPLALDLVAAAIGGGLPLARALGLVAKQLDGPLRGTLATVAAGLDMGASWEACWHASGARDPEALVIRGSLEFGVLTGAPSSALLHAEAARLRRTDHRVLERKAAALGVALVLPLGLCFLPAFLCFGVVPVVLSLLPVPQ
jgi:pilus assembly protein TadC